MSRDRDASEDFASRWSRRKRAARTAPAEPEAAPQSEAGAAGAATDEAQSDEQILEELGLPDPDTLKPGDDVSAFMASAVPARLRNRALRRLWVSNPLLANLDGLIDYGEDYTDAAMVPEVLNTAYRVGRGWAEDKDVADEDADEDAEDPAQAAGEGGDEGAAPAADTPPASEAAPERAAERRAPRPSEAAEESAEHGADEPLAQDTSAPELPEAPEADRADADPPARAQAPPRAPRRRMRFRFPDS